MANTGLRRFWFGHIGHRTRGSLVVWDRRSDSPSRTNVDLYHLKLDRIISYSKASVRPLLSPIDIEEQSVAEYALKRYLELLARAESDALATAPRNIDDYGEEEPEQAHVYYQCAVCDSVTSRTSFSDSLHCSTCGGTRWLVE